MTTQVQGLGVLILPVALIANAEHIVVAKNSGKLTAVLRNPDDAKANGTAAMSIDDVLPKQQGAKRVAVQYIVGGRS